MLAADSAAKVQIRSAADVAKLLAHIATAEQEHGYVLGLDSQHRVVIKHLAALGTVDHVHVSPRDVFRELIRANCVAMIVAHNHPSGSTTPSDTDDALTRQLTDGAKLLGIDLLDHVIVASGGHYSYAEEGKIRP